MTDNPAPRSEAGSVDALAAAQGSETVPAPEVVVITHKKRRRRYSRGLRGPQRVGRGLTRASHKLARAVTSGMYTFRLRQNRSSRKKRDGAIKDGLKNWARGMGKTMRRSSSVPYDVARAFDTKSNRRAVRSVVRAVAAISPFR